VFSGYIISVNTIVPNENPAAMALGQFAMTALMRWSRACSSMRAASARGERAGRRRAGRVDEPRLLVVFTTIGSFGLLNFFQPKVDPTRAALIYLVEPIFAAELRVRRGGSRLTKVGMAGAALILVPTSSVELREAHLKRKMTPAPDVPPV
jgi:hypothetical protein